MSTEQFWQIIEATRATTQEQQLDLLRQELEQLAPGELIEFERILSERLFAAFNWDLWVVAWLCEGGLCSDDNFMDFRQWLISRGCAVFDAALENPDSLVDEMRQTEHRAFESFSYVPANIYRELTGEELPDLALEHPKEPTGGDWLRPELKDRSNNPILNLCVVFNELGADEYRRIEQRFPRIWALCMERGIIRSSEPTPPSEVPSPEQVAATVDPNLATTDFGAYLKGLGEAARQKYRKE